MARKTEGICLCFQKTAVIGGVRIMTVGAAPTPGGNMFERCVTGGVHLLGMTFAAELIQGQLGTEWIV